MFFVGLKLLKLALYCYMLNIKKGCSFFFFTDVSLTEGVPSSSFSQWQVAYVVSVRQYVLTYMVVCLELILVPAHGRN